VQHILASLEADPPAAMLFWNVIPEYKVLLADALLDVPLFDVSPGEMFYTSFERYFAKPRPGLPYRDLREYGARLDGVIVKYTGEAAGAASCVGAPVHVIPNGVPCPEAAAPRRARPGPIVFGTAARLDPRKKVHELIAALRLAHDRLPPYLLRIAGGVERGEDEYARALLDLARGLDVEWRGEIEESGPFLRSLDVFVLVAEPAGCPNASLEAMAHGLPVIATDVGGMSEQVVNGTTGALVPPGDPAALAEAFVALAHDAQGRARMGAAGLRRVRERFDVARMAADYRRVCLGERGL
jgi:glycosyltransferase involved in cell wall biosynthesis